MRSLIFFLLAVASETLATTTAQTETFSFSRTRVISVAVSEALLTCEHVEEQSFGPKPFLFGRYTLQVTEPLGLEKYYAHHEFKGKGPDCDFLPTLLRTAVGGQVRAENTTAQGYSHYRAGGFGSIPSSCEFAKGETISLLLEAGGRGLTLESELSEKKAAPDGECDD